MNTSRFYQPAMATMTKAESKFLGLADSAGLNYFMPGELTTRRVVAARGIEDNTQISYNFSFGTRNERFLKVSGGKGSYGTRGISFRLLYEFLCETFNGGEYFIDTYFDKVFDTRSVYDQLNTLNDDIIDDIEEERDELYGSVALRSDGSPDMRYAASKRYASLEVWHNPLRAQACTDVAHDIKEDIVSCLASGRIPLRKSTVSEATAKKRERFIGLEGTNFFFASGQLIRHLNIFVALEEEE
jgi:hypothetical protein